MRWIRLNPVSNMCDLWLLDWCIDFVHVYSSPHTTSRKKRNKKKITARHSFCQHFLFTSVEMFVLMQLGLFLCVCNFYFFLLWHKVHRLFTCAVNFTPSKWPTFHKKRFKLQLPVMCPCDEVSGWRSTAAPHTGGCVLTGATDPTDAVKTSRVREPFITWHVSDYV